MKTSIVLEPPKGWSAPDIAEIWEHRELFLFLAWRDIKTRYKQTALGVGWALLPIVFNMIIFSVIFGTLAKLPSEGVPYAIFSLVGLVPWNMFSRGLNAAAASLLSSGGLSVKVYFPRLIFTLSAVLATLLDYAISLVILFALALWFNAFPSLIGLLSLIPFTMLGLLCALAAGIWLASLSVKYRDVVQGIGLLTTAWMYATPVAYSTTLIPSSIWQQFYWLNPMAIVVQGFRWAFIGSDLPPLLPTVASITILLGVLVSGLFYYQRVERTFVDLL